ncbi:hypothetical protein FKP32DRAFT_1592659 [Trametes sanguinea]|nr:hypothetical protein FKP32DRAFT_1592659 [Trametes sanguinea]
MDQTYLGLQNLLYEKRHLEREIEKCRQFAYVAPPSWMARGGMLTVGGDRSIYQDIPLHSLEEFTQLAPEEARTEDVLSDEHQLMLNRLSFELSERQRLDLRRRELIKEKETLLKESKVKAATMESVKAHIDSLMKSALEAQKKVSDLVQANPLPATPNSSTPAPS